MTIKPGSLNFTIYQGAIFNENMVWRNEDNSPVNLTGYTAKMTGRTVKNTTTSFFTLTTENGGITLGGIAGTIALLIDADDTAALYQNGVYDLDMIDAAGVPNRLLQGTITLNQRVTT